MISELGVYGAVRPAIFVVFVYSMGGCGDAVHGEAARTIPSAHRHALEATAPRTDAPSSADDESDDADDADQALQEAVFACEQDSDCVAVPKAGLCRNGLKEAVNRHHVDAYQQSLRHAHRGPCTFLLIRDRRVARCDRKKDDESGRCVLVVVSKKPDLPTVFAPEHAHRR